LKTLTGVRFFEPSYVNIIHLYTQLYCWVGIHTAYITSYVGLCCGIHYTCSNYKEAFHLNGRRMDAAWVTSERVAACLHKQAYCTV